MKNQGCDSCKKTVRKDLSANSFCNFCEMPLEKSSTLILKQNKENYAFCSQQCLQNFRTGELI